MFWLQLFGKSSHWYLPLWQVHRLFNAHSFIIIPSDHIQSSDRISQPNASGTWEIVARACGFPLFLCHGDGVKPNESVFIIVASVEIFHHKSSFKPKNWNSSPIISTHLMPLQTYHYIKPLRFLQALCQFFTYIFCGRLDSDGDRISIFPMVFGYLKINYHSNFENFPLN